MPDQRDDPWSAGLTADPTDDTWPLEPGEDDDASRLHTGRWMSPSLGAYDPRSEHEALREDSGAADEYFEKFGYGESFGDGRLGSDYVAPTPVPTPTPTPASTPTPDPDLGARHDPEPTPGLASMSATDHPTPLSDHVAAPLDGPATWGDEIDLPLAPAPAPPAPSSMRPPTDPVASGAAGPDLLGSAPLYQRGDGDAPGIDGDLVTPPAPGDVDPRPGPDPAWPAPAAADAGPVADLGPARWTDRLDEEISWESPGSTDGSPLAQPTARTDGPVDRADPGTRAAHRRPDPAEDDPTGPTDDPSGPAALDGDDLAEDSDARRNLIEWAVVLVGAVLLALVLRYLVLQAFWIPSPSMETTLLVRDRVLVNKLSYRLHDVYRGDIIVFRRTDEEIARNPELPHDVIKRVIALGGETIEIRNSQVFIDGLLLEEPYLDDGVTTSDFGPEQVPEGHIFVMGDNRELSLDSRFETGPVAEDRVVGRAFFLFWPLDRIGAL